MMKRKPPILTRMTADNSHWRLLQRFHGTPRIQLANLGAACGSTLLRALQLRSHLSVSAPFPHKVDAAFARSASILRQRAPDRSLILWTEARPRRGNFATSLQSYGTGSRKHGTSCLGAPLRSTLVELLVTVIAIIGTLMGLRFRQRCENAPRVGSLERLPLEPRQFSKRRCRRTNSRTNNFPATRRKRASSP